MERLALDAAAPHDPVELAIHVARYAVVADLCRGRRVLDIACGQGFGSYLMVRRWGAAAVYAVDRSPEALAAGRALFDTPEIRWVEMDADAIDPTRLGDPFDLIVSLETLEHVADPARFLAALKALLRSDGTLVVSCPNDHWYYGPGRSKNIYHRHVYTFAEFRTLAEGILGPAAGYFLGSTVGGFANTPREEANAPTTTLIAGLQRLSDLPAVRVPNSVPVAPTDEQSLYYIGVWGPAMPGESGTVMPLAPDRRFAVDSLRPRFPWYRHERPRIVLVADVRDWAFDNIAHHIEAHLGDALDVRIVYMREYADWTECVHELVCVHEADLAHFFWREYLLDILRGGAAARIRERYGIEEDDFLRRFSAVALTTSIYDHLYLEENELQVRIPFLWQVDAYSVSSEKLRALYTRPGLPAPDVVIEDGVDLELFRPPAGDCWNADWTELVVGWAGNSGWNGADGRDAKGLHTIIKPALEKLRAEGMRVMGRFVDSAERLVPRAEMPAFYQEIDVYVCASEIEGTPNPVLEAMACGVPVISTDVGIVPQVLGPEQRRFILAERSADALAARLRELAGNRQLLRRLSAENLVSIRSWSWAHQMPKWLQLFQIAAQRVDQRSVERRRHAHGVTRAAMATLEAVLRQQMHKMTEERDVRIAALEEDLRCARSARGALRSLGRYARWRLAWATGRG